MLCVECSAGRCVSSRFVEGRGASERRLHLQTFSRSCLPEKECLRRFLRRRRRSERSLEGRKYAFLAAVHIYELRSPARGLGAHRVGQHRFGHPSEDWLEVFMHSPAQSLAGLEVVTTCPVVQGFRATAGDGRAGCRRSGPTRARCVSFVKQGEEGLWPQSRLVQTAGVEEAVSKRPRRVSPSFIQRPMLKLDMSGPYLIAVESLQSQAGAGVVAFLARTIPGSLLIGRSLGPVSSGKELQHPCRFRCSA